MIYHHTTATLLDALEFAHRRISEGARSAQIVRKIRYGERVYIVTWWPAPPMT